jgi:GGDEF domain-containing protein
VLFVDQGYLGGHKLGGGRFMFLDRFEPQLDELEEDYRRGYLESDSEQVFIFATLTTLTNIVFSGIETWLYFPNPETYGLLALRISFLIFTGWFLVFLKRNKTPKTFDNFSLAWMLFVAIMGFIVRLLHHADPYATYITNIVEISVIFFFYLIIPTKLHYRLISTFLISAFAIIHLFFFDPFTILPHKITIISIFFLVNTVAFMSSSRSYSYRRSQYEARTQREKLTKKLEKQANTDSLTGVCNRRAFLQRVEDEFQQFIRYKKEFCLAVFDLDKFKGINDQFGHHAGDTVLMKFCEIVSSSKRDADIFGRIGGDEFALLLPFTSLLRALNVVERIQKLILKKIFK